MKGDRLCRRKKPAIGGSKAGVYQHRKKSKVPSLRLRGPLESGKRFIETVQKGSRTKSIKQKKGGGRYVFHAWKFPKDQ